MLTPIEVFAMDAGMNRLTGTIPYTSLIWKRRYYESGEFSMDIPKGVYSPDWAYIYTDDRPETGIISKVQFSDSDSSLTGEDTVTVSGFFLESLLNRKTFLAEDAEKAEWNKTPLSDLSVPHDNVEFCAKWVEIMMAEYGFKVEKPLIKGEDKFLEPSLKLLGDFVYEELRTVGASFRIAYDFLSSRMQCEFWRGFDRTQSQNVNTFAVFSDTWGTMSDYTSTEDDSNYRNKCYVLYEYEMPDAWQSNGAPYTETLYDWEEYEVTKNVYGPEGEVVGTVTVQEMRRVIAGYNIPYHTVRGYHVARIEDGNPDIETVVDRSNDTPTFDEEWTHGEVSDIADLKAPAGLKAKYDALASTYVSAGLSHLIENYPAVSNLDTGTLSQGDYMVNWDLGDKVDTAVDSLGIQGEARIIGVDESYSAGKPVVRPIIGDEIMSLYRRSRLL